MGGGSLNVQIMIAWHNLSSSAVGKLLDTTGWGGGYVYVRIF